MPSVTLSDAFAALLASNRNGTLATLRRDGRPQQSVVSYAWTPLDPGYDAPVLRISTTDGRAKTANLRRDPRASLLVTAVDSDWSYVVADGRVELSEVAADPHDAAVDELVELYRTAAHKEHPDWDEYRAVMVADRRLVIRLVVTHAYGMVQ